MSDKIDAPTKAIAEMAGHVQRLLWAKLMGQLTAEQRDMLLTTQTLVRLHDAARPNDPYQQAETNVTHARILETMQHAELLLTGCDWAKIHVEDQARDRAAIARSMVTK